MNKKEAIKYLKQLYPNGGHCWLDEQRMEAIDMAVKALQEEPVSEELEKAADKYSNHDYNYFDVLVTEYDGTEHWMDDKMFIKDAFIEGAKWKEQQFETERLKHCELKKEPISEGLEEAAFDYAEACKYDGGEKLLCVEHFKAGAQWQKEQFEKERLKHCDALTEEQAQMESDFVVDFIKKNNRTPTFIDAIEYGVKLKLKDGK